MEFQSSIDRYTITFNATQLATELNLMNPANITALLLPFGNDDLLVSISPATLNISMPSESPKPSSASNTYSDTATNFCTPSVSIITTTSTLLSTVQLPASSIYVTVQPTGSITRNTVYVTVQPTDAVSTQASSDDVTSSIIGGLLVIIVIVITIISVIASIIMYRCGKKAGQMESIQNTCNVDTTNPHPSTYSKINTATMDIPTMYDDVTTPLPPPPQLVGDLPDPLNEEEIYEDMTATAL